jgi:LmbE family N-acetylglucosaminyl deacetylase
MLGLTFRTPKERPFRILCIGAHSDDIEIGCGGTIIRLMDTMPGAEVHWVVLGASSERVPEALGSANLFLANAGKKEIIVKGFRDGFFPYVAGEIKQFFEELKELCNPDLVLTHYRKDLHQDHRLVSDLTWNTFRSHLILEYEIVKYDGDLGAPNFFVQLTDAVCRRKIENIMCSFRSQRSKTWFTEDTFLAMLRIRGVECNAADKYAEAFYCRKFTY